MTRPPGLGRCADATALACTAYAAGCLRFPWAVFGHWRVKRVKSALIRARLCTPAWPRSRPLRSKGKSSRGAAQPVAAAVAPSAFVPPAVDASAWWTSMRVCSDLDALVDPASRGDPMSPLRWTCKSAANLAAELRAQGHTVSERSVNRLLHDSGLQPPVQPQDDRGRRSPGPGRPVPAHQPAGQSSIRGRASRWSRWIPRRRSLIGDSKNGGREWQP